MVSPTKLCQRYHSLPLSQRFWKGITVPGFSIPFPSPQYAGKHHRDGNKTVHPPSLAPQNRWPSVDTGWPYVGHYRWSL